MRVLRSIRAQLLAIILICYLVPALLLGLYMGTVLSGDMEEKTGTALSSGAEYAWTLSQQKLQQVFALARDATYDGELTEDHAQWAAAAISDAEFLRLSRTYIDRKYNREELLSFAAYCTVEAPDTLITTSSGRTAAAAYQAATHAEVLQLCETLDTQLGFWQDGDQCYLVRNLLDLHMDRYGMLILGLNTDKLFSALHELCADWDAALQIRLGILSLTYPAGRIPLTADWHEMSTGLTELPKEDALLYVRRSTSNRDAAFDVCLTLNRTHVYSDVYALRQLMYGLLLLLIPVLAVFAVYLHKRIIKPITLLSDAARRIEDGELGITVPLQSADELGQLGTAFSSMSVRIRELIDKTYKEELALRDAQLQAMQSRINPHFINNALETINWEARLEGSDRISAMVESMSVLLDASMSRRNRRQVPLREEISVAEAYLYFIGLRFGQRLTVTCDVAEEAREAIVPLLTIQPLLENAVEHGIAPAGGGMLTLRCRMDQGMVTIEVVNSGHPLTDEDRKLIDHALSDAYTENGHLGLNNIATRLRLLYDGAASIQVYSDDDNHTVVLVCIPSAQEQNKKANL